jgi:hypothetical protein
MHAFLPVIGWWLMATPVSALTDSRGRLQGDDVGVEFSRPDLRAWITDPEGAKSYPIATYTWMLFYKDNKDPKKAAALREMVDYCVSEGQKMSEQMGYIPLPASVVAAVRKASSSIQ